MTLVTNGKGSRMIALSLALAIFLTSAPPALIIANAISFACGLIVGCALGRLK